MPVPSEPRRSGLFPLLPGTLRSQLASWLRHACKRACTLLTLVPFNKLKVNMPMRTATKRRAARRPRTCTCTRVHVHVQSDHSIYYKHDLNADIDQPRWVVITGVDSLITSRRLLLVHGNYKHTEHAIFVQVFGMCRPAQLPLLGDL